MYGTGCIDREFVLLESAHTTTQRHNDTMTTTTMTMTTNWNDINYWWAVRWVVRDVPCRLFATVCSEMNCYMHLISIIQQRSGAVSGKGNRICRHGHGQLWHESGQENRQQNIGWNWEHTVVQWLIVSVGNGLFVTYCVMISVFANPFMDRERIHIQPKLVIFVSLWFWQFDVPFNQIIPKCNAVRFSHTKHTTRCYFVMNPKWILLLFALYRFQVVKIGTPRIHNPHLRQSIQFNHNKTNLYRIDSLRANVTCVCVYLSWNAIHSTAVPSDSIKIVCAFVYSLHYARQLAAWLAVNWLYPHRLN